MCSSHIFQSTMRLFIYYFLVSFEKRRRPLINCTLVVMPPYFSSLQVHKRITYLRHLIVSLAQARDISKAMLIFSHDFYHEEINELVQSVDFCKVMQIYYPYSIQTHPHEFPGEDPNDCDRNMKKEQ